ncbi:serine hydrolase domain-containing protein [Nocardia sp. NPDC088792]|uniref:serine hydrolase domain-containing protein n=1 Tax=Nocardia sp. NPDC088792 TaxID=3364332 RepID=UPI003815C69B
MCTGIRVAAARTGLVLAVVAALLTACGHGSATGPAAMSAQLSGRIDAIVTAHKNAGLLPAVSVAVVDPVRGRYIHAYGSADLATGRAAGVGDHFRIGSVATTFIATAVLRLADAGRLSLDDPVARYIADVPRGDTMTVRDLLGARSGVYDFLDAPETLAAQYTGDSGWNDQQTIRAIAAHPAKAAAPRTGTAYSNSEPVLLGSILEKVTGKSVDNAIGDIVTGDGLRDTTTLPDRGTALPAPALHGYAYPRDTPVDLTAQLTAPLFEAAGTMQSTITDLARYAPLLAHGNLLNPQTAQARTQFTDLSQPRERQLEPHEQYGLGLMRTGQWIGFDSTVSGRLTDLGYTTTIGYLPDRDATVVVTTNLGASPPGITAATLWADIVHALYPGTLPDSDTAPTMPVPTAADLDVQLSRALDPTRPAAAKSLRVEGSDADPDLITRVAQAYHDTFATTIRVVATTELRPGVMVATTTKPRMAQEPSPR